MHVKKLLKKPVQRHS